MRTVLMTVLVVALADVAQAAPPEEKDKAYGNGAGVVAIQAELLVLIAQSTQQNELLRQMVQGQERELYVLKSILLAAGFAAGGLTLRIMILAKNNSNPLM